MNDDLEILREAINSFDDVGDGCVYVKDAGKTLRTCGLYPSEESINKQLGNLLDNPEERVGLNVLIPMYNELKKDSINTENPVKTIEPILNFLDREGTGSIKISDLRLMLQTYGEKLSNIEMDAVFSSLPINEDGYISKESFIREICFDTF
uniref:EF-hand domain-containing protein n=1 Tax=Strongyloides stercoralis TaxID=6248 RepID=A0A0K0E2K3_STRER